MQILKENEEGFGILLEADAGVLSPTISQKLVEGTHISKIDLTHPIIYYATLQKYGVENKNGRIYPEHILRREVERYKEIIRMNSSFHEMDHPEECCDIDTEILTESGWKYLKDISETERVCTLNQKTNNIEINTITHKIDQSYNGKMIHLHSRNLDMVVTPNHRFWIINKNTRDGKFVTAQEIHDGSIKSIGDYFIPKKGNWVGVDYTKITISGIPPENLGKRCSKELRLKYREDLIIDAVVFFRFMGIWLSEGGVQGSKGSKKYGYRITIDQKNEEKTKYIRELLSQMPLYWGETITKTAKTTFTCSDARLHNYLINLGNSYTKYIPQELKQANPFLLSELFEWFLMGDGRCRYVGKSRSKNYEAKEVFSTSKNLIDDLHEILIKTGGSGNIREENRQYDSYIENRLICAENKHNMFFLHISSTSGIWLDKRNLITEEISYNNHIYCVEVPNNIFYARRNGKSVWSGNSIISLKGGSPYRILDLFWKGNVLIGKLEVLVSEGYRRSGIISCNGDLLAHYLNYGMTVGISSRGVGSLKKIQGKNMVQDDFELVCWDAVSSPSTVGSFLYKDLEDFNTYDNLDPIKPEPSDNKTTQSEFMNKLSYFLGKN